MTTIDGVQLNGSMDKIDLINGTPIMFASVKFVSNKNH